MCAAAIDLDCHGRLLSGSTLLLAGTGKEGQRDSARIRRRSTGEYMADRVGTGGHFAQRTSRPPVVALGFGGDPGPGQRIHGYA
jgi:hypothetical protein